MGRRLREVWHLHSGPGYRRYSGNGLSADPLVRVDGVSTSRNSLFLSLLQGAEATTSLAYSVPLQDWHHEGPRPSGFRRLVEIRI